MCDGVLTANGPFRLIVTVKRGVAGDIPAIWIKYRTLEAARKAADSLFRDERVAHIMITDDAVPPHWIEWAA